MILKEAPATLQETYIFCFLFSLNSKPQCRSTARHQKTWTATWGEAALTCEDRDSNSLINKMGKQTSCHLQSSKMYLFGLWEHLFPKQTQKQHTDDYSFWMACFTLSERIHFKGQNLKTHKLKLEHKVIPTKILKMFSNYAGRRFSLSKMVCKLVQSRVVWKT